MVTLTQNQVYERWDTLPDSLHEALTSDENSDYIWKVAGAEHIPDEKIDLIARAVSQILYGFLHPEDLADEIKNSVGVNAQLAGAIAKSIDQRIFAPVKSDLSKAYKPVAQPLKVMQDVAPTSQAKPQPIPAGPQIISQTVKGNATIGTSPLASNVTKPAPAPVAPAPAPQPKPTSDIGWSRSSSAQPVVKLNQTVAPLPRPTASGPVTPMTNTRPASSIAMNGSMGEFERMAAQKSTTPVPTPSAPIKPIVPTGPSAMSSASSAPAPIILHEVATFKAAPQAPDFHLSLPADQLAGAKSGQSQQARTVIVEIGKPVSAAGSTAVKPAAAPTTNTVHYTDYIKQNPELNAQRSISEVTSPVTPVAVKPMSFTPAPSAPMTFNAPVNTPRPVAAPPPLPPKPPASQQQTQQPAQQPQNTPKVSHIDYTA